MRCVDVDDSYHTTIIRTSNTNSYSHKCGLSISSLTGCKVQFCHSLASVKAISSIVLPSNHATTQRFKQEVDVTVLTLWWARVLPDLEVQQRIYRFRLYTVVIIIPMSLRGAVIGKKFTWVMETKANPSLEVASAPPECRECDGRKEGKTSGIRIGQSVRRMIKY